MNDSSTGPQGESTVANQPDEANHRSPTSLLPTPTFLHGLPAWLLSLLLHAVILVLLGLMVRVAHRGATLEPARGGGIVLARDVEGQAEYFRDADDGSETALETPDDGEANQTSLPDTQQLPIDLEGALPQAVAARDESTSATATSANNLTEGLSLPPRGSIDGQQARTSVFGAEGVGSKFVYVFDRSASMNGYQGRPLRAAKNELIASLEDLDKVHQFQVIFYNEKPTVFNPFYPESPRMLFGDAPTKRRAQNFVRGIVAAGGTQHTHALHMALDMAPDVIFFLTDAAEPQLTQTQLQEVRRRNNRVGAAIHAIEFGAGPNQGGNNFLQRLAAQNAGKHVYVDITRLPLQ